MIFGKPLIYALALNLLTKREAFSTILECYVGFFGSVCPVSYGFFLLLFFRNLKPDNYSRGKNSKLLIFHSCISTVGVNLPDLFKERMGCHSGVDSNTGYSSTVVCSSSVIQ